LTGLRIGITCYPTYGGSGIVATELGLELAQRGHDVHFISYAAPIRLDTSLDNVHYHEVEVANYPLFQFPPYCLALASRMAEVAERYSLDLLHVHYAIPHSVSAMLARDMTPRRLPFVTTLHGTDVTLVGVEPSYFPITKHAIEKSDGVTVISDFLLRETLDVFGITRPITRIHNFVNCDLYRPAEPRTHARPRLLHISNFRPVKRVEDCVRVLAKVRETIDCELWMAGDGPQRSSAERLANELRVDPHVRFLGKQDHIERLIPQTDLLLMPSEREAFGLAALEAMACGVPAIAASSGGIGELITDGHDGALAPVGDTARMAERAVALLSDRGLYERVSAAARETAVSRFATERIIPQYEQLYRTLA
jgi:N-acetyl-alpha-D-glucosaminyl L-malate synthase BshA